MTYTKFFKLTILIFAAVLLFISCDVNNSSDNDGILFTERYIAGTTAPVESTRYSPYIIHFESESAAHLISATASFPGTYTFQDETLFFQTDDLEKVAEFSIVNNQIISSHYEVRFYNEDGTYDPAPVQYTASGELGITPEANQLAGQSFTGDQYRFGTEGVFQENFTYIFSDTDDTYGSGTEDIDNQDSSYQLYNNVAFRYQEGNSKEFGVLINNQLVAFKESGLFYWGTFNPK